MHWTRLLDGLNHWDPPHLCPWDLLGKVENQGQPGDRSRLSVSPCGGGQVCLTKLTQRVHVVGWCFRPPLHSKLGNQSADPASSDIAAGDRSAACAHTVVAFLWFKNLEVPGSGEVWRCGV